MAIVATHKICLMDIAVRNNTKNSFVIDDNFMNLILILYSCETITK